MDAVKNSSGQDLRHWQVRIFATVWITYFAFYLCRYNMPMVTGQMGEAFSWDKSQMGIVFSSLLLMYAVGQFVNRDGQENGDGQDGHVRDHLRDFLH